MLHISVVKVYNSKYKFPDKLKLAVIKPKLKIRILLINYGPIYTMNNFTYILKKIIKAWLLKFLENNKFLSKNQ